jgi:hypothetical protein
MSHAPKGGCYVPDHLAGTEKFYDGGQFLPEAEPPIKKKAKKVAKKVESLHANGYETGDIILRPTIKPCFALSVVKLINGSYVGTATLATGTDRKAMIEQAIAIAAELDKNVVLA